MNYRSKREIYQDFQIAIKLGIDSKIGGLGKGSYQELYEKLHKDHHSTIKELEWGIENFNNVHPYSTGVLVEITEKGNNDEGIGVRYIFLEHESGLEVFVKLSELIQEHPVVSTLVGREVAKHITKKSMNKLFSFLTKKWDNVMGYKIYFIEIRTKDKGVMRLRFDDFKVQQLKCLVSKFSEINHLNEVNQSCFEGKLMNPPSDIPLSDD